MAKTPGSNAGRSKKPKSQLGGKSFGKLGKGTEYGRSKKETRVAGSGRATGSIGENKPPKKNTGVGTPGVK